MIRLHCTIAAATFLACGSIAAHAATACELLTATQLKNGTVLSARTVAAGQYAAPGGTPAAQQAVFAKLPGFCRVEAKLTPSADSDIRIELWLPLAGWNGKLVESGNGAFSPALSYDVMSQMLAKGYAATSSNTGHEDNNAKFALDHPEQLIDFGYRAVHENVVAAKAIVAAFYGNPARKAYFQGCSTGGRQAYGAAQHYPEDFDGIVAGAPGIQFTHQTGAELWTIQQVHNNPAMVIPAEKLSLLKSAVVKACDELDGVKDGVIENPLKCEFDPSVLQCKGAEERDCLSSPQVELARMIYRGAATSKGVQIYPGLPKGTEWGWGITLIRTEPMEYGIDAYRYVVMKDPKWGFSQFDLEHDVALGDERVGSIMNNFDPNLKPFFAHGGKLLGYHGWADPMNSALNHIRYYNLVADEMGGKEKIDSLYRLFFVPGMHHCGEGDGTDSFDLMTVMDAWVESGQAPASIPAARVVDGKVVRTRPLCPLPQQAVYKGSGSTDDAANFRCAVK